MTKSATKALKELLRKNLRPMYNLLFNIRELAKGRKPIEFGDFNIGDIQHLCHVSSPIILDIGSNDGAEILYFLEKYPESQIYAVEADPKPFNRLEKRFINDKRVKCFNIAIADFNGIIAFNCSSGYFTESQKLNDEQHDYSGSILEPKLHLEMAPNVKFEQKIEVRCLTLDSFISCNNLISPDFIWMDVQGSEYIVLKGASKTLNKVSAIYTEYGLSELYEGQKDLWFIANYLKTFGFKLKTRFIGDALFCK